MYLRKFRYMTSSCLLLDEPSSLNWTWKVFKNFCTVSCWLSRFRERNFKVLLPLINWEKKISTLSKVWKDTLFLSTYTSHLHEKLLNYGYCHVEQGFVNFCGQISTKLAMSYVHVQFLHWQFFGLVLKSLSTVLYVGRLDQSYFSDI